MSCDTLGLGLSWGSFVVRGSRFGHPPQHLPRVHQIRSPPALHPPVPFPSPAKALSPPRQWMATANWRSLCCTSDGIFGKVRFPFPPSFHSSSHGSAHEQSIPNQLPFPASTSADGPSTGADSASDLCGQAQSHSLIFANYLASLTSSSPSSSSVTHGRPFDSLPPPPLPSRLAAYRGRRDPTHLCHFFACFGFRTPMPRHGRLGGRRSLARLVRGDPDSDVDK